MWAFIDVGSVAVAGPDVCACLDQSVIAAAFQNVSQETS